MDKELETRLNNIERYTILAAKNVLTIDDVALLTGLSKSYLYRLTCERKIPFYKPNGKQIYFDRKEIENWQRQNRVKTVEEASQFAANYELRKRFTSKSSGPK